MKLTNTCRIAYLKTNFCNLSSDLEIDSRSYLLILKLLNEYFERSEEQKWFLLKEINNDSKIDIDIIGDLINKKYFFRNPEDDTEVAINELFIKELFSKVDERLKFLNGNRIKVRLKNHYRNSTWKKGPIGLGYFLRDTHDQLSYNAFILCFNLLGAFENVHQIAISDIIEKIAAASPNKIELINDLLEEKGQLEESLFEQIVKKLKTKKYKNAIGIDTAFCIGGAFSLSKAFLDPLIRELNREIDKIHFDKKYKKVL